jgi:hypothetical protein
MHLDDIHLDEPEKAGEAIDPHPHAFAALAFLDAQLVHGVRDRGEGPLW